MLWEEDGPASMIQGYIDSTWEQLGDGIPMDLTLEEFERVAENLLDLEA